MNTFIIYVQALVDGKPVKTVLASVECDPNPASKDNKKLLKLAERTAKKAGFDTFGIENATLLRSILGAAYAY